MKEILAIGVLSGLFMFGLAQSGFWDSFSERSKVVHNYEYRALELAREIRAMKNSNQKLKEKVFSLTAENQHLRLDPEVKNKFRASRAIASVPKTKVEDLVQFEIYEWKPEKLLGIGRQAFHFQKWEKAAQYLNAYLKHYPNHKAIDDKVLYEAGIASYESKRHYDAAQKNFDKLMTNFPKSDHLRGAKLWSALTHFKKGDHRQFMKAVDEFRMKYRNTNEWKVLSKYYEDIAFNFQRQ